MENSLQAANSAVGEYAVKSSPENLGVPQMHVDRLTKRQRDCLQLVAQGYTSKEIGRYLALSPSTVDNHVTAATQTLFAANRAEAARIYSSSKYGQHLPSQSLPLAEIKFAGFHPSRTEANSWVQFGSQMLALPPIGGQRNDLGWTERTVRIFQVAVIGLGTMIGLTMLVAGAFLVFG